MKENNELIAEFMGVDYVDIDTYLENNKELQYHKNWNWLMPVIQKCLIGEAEHNEDVSNLAIKNIYEGICNQDISLAYQSVVEFINEYNKYICGYCGEHCNEVTYNEDKDIDECNNCK